MARMQFIRRARVALVGLAIGGANVAFAQQPPAPFPVVAPAEEPVEIIYGIRKVSTTPAEVIPVSASISTSRNEAKTAEAFVEALHSVRDGTRDITAATVGLLGKVGDRVKRTSESHPIILASYTIPALPTPAQQAPAISQPASPPQVIVVREAAPTTALTLSLESAIAFGVGLVGVLFVAWARGSRTVARSALPSAIAPPVSFDPNLVQLSGQYNAGSKREPAERFDLGPTYRDDVQRKHQMEEANNSAAVEFILNQNLALLTALKSMEPEAAAPALA